MVKIHLISVAKSDSSFDILNNEYKKRLNWQFIETEIYNPKKISVNQILAHEAKLISQKLQSKSYKIILDLTGKLQTSEEFAKTINLAIENYDLIEFVIGGAYGLDASILKSANLILSLSRLTFPHKLVKLILFEQIYRAKTIIDAHPYHK